MKPEFVDNRKGNTLKVAFAGHLEHRIATGKTPKEVCIATAYFNPAGFAQISAQLAKVPKVRLMLGAEPTPESALVRRKPLDPPEPEFSRRRLPLPKTGHITCYKTGHFYLLSTRTIPGVDISVYLCCAD